MPVRQDANRIALRVARALLDAAVPLKFDVEGTTIDVKVERLPGVPWPANHPEGLDKAADGPWPRALRADCTWTRGSQTLIVEATPWTSGTYEHLVALRVGLASIRQELIWCTLALPLRDATDGAECAIPASFSLYKRKGEVPEGTAVALKAAVDLSGLPLTSPYRIELCRVRLPEGDVLPSPAEAFRRLIHLALLKLPFLVKPGAGSAEAVPFRIDTSGMTLSNTLESSSKPAKRTRLGRFPGGVRQYKATLDAFLTWIDQEPRSVQDFEQYLHEHYEVQGAASISESWRLLMNLRVVEERNDSLELTARGVAYRESSDPLTLFEYLHESFAGMLETLVIADFLNGAGQKETRRLLNTLLGTEWQAQNQSAYRRNWLLSLGLTERSRAGDVPTALGRDVLNRHANEALAILQRLRDLPKESTATSGLASDEEASLDTAGEPETEPRDEAGEPDGWLADRLDLTVTHVQPHLGNLEVPRGVLERACAALSAGKHLLLVGPPGTGKTELAHVLASAARTEGYCLGLFESTASADWTTYETIGGYALERDQSLRFRPGTFLRAIGGWQWLLVDELNRADVDKAFGELMTVLAGRGTDTPFEMEGGQRVSIGFDSGRTHRVSRTFRVIATMNTWDKTSLFRLSYAVQRRFAIIHIGIPSDDSYSRLISRAALDSGLEPPLDESTVRRLSQVFHRKGLLAYRDIGPAIALDIIRYMRRRAASGDGLAEAISMFLLPQLEGLDSDSARKVYELFRSVLTGWTSEEALHELRARCEDVWPPGALPSS